MRVLITGAYGLIGAASLTRLHRDGHELIGAGRSIADARRRFPYARWEVADFDALTTARSWHALLDGIDAVVNCAGALQDGARDNLRRVHVEVPAALFAACEEKGVRRVIHVSAVGAGPDGVTAFARTKGETERDLRSRNLDWIILRPGLVLARGAHGGTALVRAAAGVPFVTPVVPAKPIQIVAVKDVAETVAWALRPGAPARLTLEPVHPQPLALGAIVAAYRGWLGLKPQPTIVLPRLITAVAKPRRMRWHGSDGAAPCERPRLPSWKAGVTGDATSWIAATGIAPKSLDDILAGEPATVAERWFARLYLLKPLAIAVLAAFWIASGVIALGPGFRARC